MPHISDKKINTLLDLIYETTIEPSSEGWDQVYKTMSDTLSSGPGGLSIHLRDKNKFELVAATFNEESFQEYNNYYHKISPFRRKIGKMEAGEIFRRSEHCPDEDFQKTEIYQDYFKRNDVFYYDYFVLFKELNVSGGISFTRPESMENFNAQENKAMNLLMPHIRRAFQVYYKISKFRKDSQILEEVLNRIPQSVIVVNKLGEAIYVNDNAQKIIGKKDGLQIDRKGNLVANSAKDTKNLRKALHGVFHPNIEKKVSHGGIIQFPRPSGSRPFSILVSPVKNQAVFSVESETAALLFITDPEQKIETVEQVLCDIYDLTRTESKLAAILAEGNSLKEACILLDVKENTVRTHLKHIFSKTETHRQSELIKLILTGPANLRKVSVKAI